MKYCEKRAESPAPTRNEDTRWKNPAPVFLATGAGAGADADFASVASLRVH